MGEERRNYRALVVDRRKEVRAEGEEIRRAGGQLTESGVAVRFDCRLSHATARVES